MDFPTAFSVCLRQKFAVFGGRACRAEYWYFTVPVLLSGIVADAVDDDLPTVSLLLSLALVLLATPQMAVGIRRLHDINRSGWWLLLSVVPVLGWLVLAVWFCQRGDSGANRYGADPLRA